MVKITKKSYSLTRFRRIVKKVVRENGNTDVQLKNDQSDALIYLLLMDYLTKLIKQSESVREEQGTSELRPEQLNQVHERLMKYYQG